MKNKKGLSSVIATVLIVLLALAAVAIVAGFLLPIFRDSGTTTSASVTCLEAEVKPTNCDSLTGNVNVQWVKGDITKIIAIVEHSDGLIRTNVSTATTILSTTTHNFGPGGASFINTGDKARAAAVILDDNSQEITCPESQTEIICA